MTEERGVDDFMKAKESPLVDLLRGPRQYLIPIYQRTYSWGAKQCEQLWDDLLRVSADERQSAHFIGSVVYVEEGLYHATSLPRLLVIDGQQRLTTFSLIVEALARVLESQSEGAPEITARKLRHYFLLNAEEDGELRYKLVLSRGDSDTLRSIMEKTPLPDQPADRLVENFRFFEEKISACHLRPADLYRGLNKLLVVDIALDRERDNPQLIFESLNSTGLDLSQADLVRNFVLMGLEPEEQRELYRDYWYPMERSFVNKEGGDLFDRFLRAWLTIKLGEVPNRRRGYEEFKNYRGSHAKTSIRELVEDLHDFAGHYAAIALGKEDDAQLRSIYVGLRQLRVDVPLPFLMVCYAHYRNGQLPHADLVTISQLVESWLFRRAVCEIPSNVLSRTFASLLGQVDPENLLESFTGFLLTRQGRQRFPTDDEFRTQLQTRNLYEARHRNYCLSRLENVGRTKEKVSVGEFTIEHVLPQNKNLSEEWRQELGAAWEEDQERWLHTLGNLTLTGYNSELSDRPFKVKRDQLGGFADSPIRLNRDLAGLDRWNANEIERRGRALAASALEIWRTPTLRSDVLDKYRERLQTSQGGAGRYDLDHFVSLRGRSLDLLEDVRRRTEKLGLVESIWKYFIGYSGSARSRPYSLIVWPRVGFLLLSVNYPFADIEAPPENWRAFRDGKRTRGRVRDSRQLGEMLDLLDRSFELKGSNPQVD